MKTTESPNRTHPVWSATYGAWFAREIGLCLDQGRRLDNVVYDMAHEEAETVADKAMERISR